MATIREHISIKEIQRRGISIIPGNKYIPKSWIPKRAPALSEIRKRLAKIKGSLAETVAQIRDEE